MTTILCVRKKNRVVMAGDGQVSMQNTIMKPSARKLRNTFDGKVIAGFAGSTADAFTLFEKFDEKLEQYNFFNTFKIETSNYLWIMVGGRDMQSQ